MSYMSFKHQFNHNFLCHSWVIWQFDSIVSCFCFNCKNTCTKIGLSKDNNANLKVEVERKKIQGYVYHIHKLL